MTFAEALEDYESVCRAGNKYVAAGLIIASDGTWRVWVDSAISFDEGAKATAAILRNAAIHLELPPVAGHA